MTARQTRRPRQGLLAWLSLLFPLGASLAAQVTWGLRTGSTVLVVWGCLATVLLALSIHRWRRLPPGLVRDLAMAGVVVAVGGWTWLHTALLLISELPPEPNRFVHYLSVGLCVAAFLPIEGLAVLSVLALDAPPTPASSAAPTAGPSSTTSQTSPPALSQDTDTAATDAEPWGGPDAVDAPVTLPAAASVERPATTARVTPMRRTNGSVGDHEPGWREDMAAVHREPGMTADVWIRRRAAALTPKVTQAGKKHRELRRDVERAEVTQAQRAAEDDERERVPA